MELNTEESKLMRQNIHIKYVDFAQPELCANSDPVNCFVDGEKICGRNWRELLVALIEKYILEKNLRIAELYDNPLLNGSSRPFLLAERPKGTARQLSNGYWIYINYNIPTLVTLIGNLATYCGSSIEITYTPKINNRSVTSDSDSTDRMTISAIPQKVLTVLSEKFAAGFRFESTSIRLLADETGIEIDRSLQNLLKCSMFCRRDNVCFLIDSVVDEKVGHSIISVADNWLDKYGCFEASELYTLFVDKIHSGCIAGTEDFLDFLKCIYKQDVCYGKYYGIHIVYMHKRISNLIKNIANDITIIIRDEFGGGINEVELKSRFAAFSVDLLSKIIKQKAGELFKTEINGVVCYQTFDTLGISDEFPQLLSDALSQIEEVDLVPSKDVLNIVLSIKMGINFRREYNIVEDQMFCRLISMYYRTKPRREWKGSVFVEVSN